MGKTAIEFSLLPENEKYEAYTQTLAALHAMVALHQDDPFLRVTICGDMLVRIHFNGAEKPARNHLDELINVLIAIRDGFNGGDPSPAVTGQGNE